MNECMSDNELLRASLAGDREAFGAIVRRYQSLVCAITYSGTGDLGTSEELAQETFLRAWKGLRQLEDLSRFRAWLCTIARNLANRTMRRSPRDVLARADSLESAEAVTAGIPDPGQTAVDKELQALVWAAVQRVPESCREPLVLFYREGQSARQVAAELDLSEDAVRQRLCRGRQFIKAELASLVEETLARSGPGKSLAVAVVAALPAIVTPTAGAAATGLAAKGAPAAKTVFAAGLTGALLGPILGLVGGILGVWCGIRNTNSPRERRFMIRMAGLVWLLLFALVGIPLTMMLAGLIPKWAYWSCFALFFAILLPLVFWSNAHQHRIQVEEGTCGGHERGLVYASRPGGHGRFAGPIFGGTLWLLILTAFARDWVSFTGLILCDLLLLLGATTLYRRDPQRYWSVSILTACTLMAMMLTAINLRWTAWMHAYRQSSAYDPGNDFSLTTINLVLLGLVVALVTLFATQYARRKTTDKDRTTGSCAR